MKKGLITLMGALTLAAGVVVSAWVMQHTAAAATETAVPFFRLNNPVSGQHFYTASPAERDFAITAGGYRYEAVQGYIDENNVAGTVPLYRLVNPTTGEHIYTTVMAMGNQAVAAGFRFEGAAGFVSDTPNSLTTPLYRTMGPRTGDHFYTTDGGEFNAVVSHGMNNEGIEAFMFSTTNGTVQNLTTVAPLYRLYAARTGDHFYAASSAARDGARSVGYILDGTTGLVAVSPSATASSLYRLYNPYTGDHFYTAYDAERNAAQGNGYVYEGVAGYVANTAAANTTPLYRAYAPRTGDHFYTANAAEYQAVQSAGYQGEGIAAYVYIGETTATTPTPTPTVTPSGSPSPTPTVTPTPTATPTPTPTPTPQPNLIANPSVETGAANAPTGWGHDGSPVAQYTFTSPATGGQDGSKYLQTQMTGTSTSAYGDWSFTPVAITPTATQMYKYSDYYKADVDTEVDAEITFSDGTPAQHPVLGRPLAAAGWTKFTASFSVPANATSVTVYHLISKKGTLSTDNFYLGNFVPTGLTGGGKISLTFDDGWKSIHDNALPILTTNGFTSTQFIVTSVTDVDSGYMTKANIQDFVNRGDEIGDHTYQHIPLTDKVALAAAPGGAATVHSEIFNALESLRTWFPGQSITDFATPQGEYDSQTIAEVTADGLTHRSVEEGYNSPDADVFNRYDIKVQNITRATTLAEVQGWINRAKATNTWLVIVYHEITNTPAEDVTGVTTDQQYWTPVTDFTNQMAAVKASGMPTVTMQQGLAAINAQLH